MICAQPGCIGRVVYGYCDVCGLAPHRTAVPTAASASIGAAPFHGADGGPMGASASAPSATSTQPSRTAATPIRRHATRRTTARSRLGAGLVAIPATPYRDPGTAVLEHPELDEARRFCGHCGEPVGRSREGAPGRPDGFCRSCSAPFSFAPKLTAGEVVAGQYEVVGCLAHGGMGWVYLARDHNVSGRWVVLKGLLNSGDADAMAAALAERRFLAEVEHPNIVRIHNFVQHGSSGYIVMEYVGGTSLKDVLRARRAANGMRHPLPVAQAIAYILEILPAFSYLHDRGLLFCDFKLDNVIQTEHSLKLVDLGGVYRIGDGSSPVYGTVGYQAPEIAQSGPTVASDLFTVGRTLALMCFDFQDYQGRFTFTLPEQDAIPELQRFDSLYRFLFKTTAPDRDDRFQSADEMADQLFGVLREVVALEDGRTVAATSTFFTGDLRPSPERADWRQLPLLRVAPDDPAAGHLATLSATEPAALVEQLQHAPVQTIEVGLGLARALTEIGQWRAAHNECDAIHQEDPWEWRAAWARGVAYLAEGRARDAARAFEDVYAAVPGELAAKLALGVAHELANAPERAMHWYETVTLTDPSYPTAAFGLARCRTATGDRAGALAALDRVPPSLSSHEKAQIAKFDLLSAPGINRTPDVDDLRAAASTLESLGLEPERRARLSIKLLLSALAVVQDAGAWPGPDDTLLDVALTERDLRVGIERGYRTFAHATEDPDERIRLVDLANDVRPMTWT